MAEVKARPAPPLDPLPVMQQFETFEYAAQALRDPFSDAFTDSTTAAAARVRIRARRKQTLEQFPLDSLDMVGTLGGGAGLVGAGDGAGQGDLPRAARGTTWGRATVA